MNFTTILTKRAEKQPKVVAIVMPKEVISYKLLDDLVWKCAAYFHHFGVKENDVLIMQCNNELLHIVSILAAARIGATALPISRNITESFLAYLLKEVNVHYFLADNTLFPPSNLKSIRLDRSILDTMAIDVSILIPDPKAPWLVVLGSGSTGKRKLLPISHAQQLNRMKQTQEIFSIETNDRLAVTASLDTQIANTMFSSALYSGASFAFMDNKDKSLEKISNHYQVNILFTVPFKLHPLINTLETNKPLPFKALIVSTAIVTDSLRQYILSNITNNLYITYGASEVHQISVLKPSDINKTDASVGYVNWGSELEIVDRNNIVLPVNVAGLIRIKTIGMIHAYLNDDEATKKAFRDGWFYPGDIGKFTEDGQLIYLGRSDDMMVINGINIFPLHIESAMLEHPDIIDAKAFPLKSDIHQDIPICCVVLKDGVKINESTLMQYAQEKLGIYRPRKIVILEKILKSPNGKILKNELVGIINDKL